MGKQARIAGALLIALPAAAQELRILSEFRRPDPFGGIAAPDRGGSPREIISPAVARNAWASFHIAVTVPQGAEASLYVQQNPEIFTLKLYREAFVKTAAGWVPDGLSEVKAPYAITLPDPAAPVPSQTTVGFWLDIWVPPNAPVRRVRVEALLRTGDLWLQSPLEVRVFPTVAPSVFSWGGPVPEAGERADAALAAVLCGKPASPGRPETRIPALIRRNAIADVGIAGEKGKLEELRGACKTPPPDAEWWLKVRDGIYRTP